MYYIPVYQIRNQLASYLTNRNCLLHPLNSITAEFALDDLDELNRKSLSQDEVVHLISHARLFSIGQSKRVTRHLIGGIGL